MNPHRQARIENTWTTTGRYGGRWADLSFANPTGAGACLVKGVRLGGAGLEAEIGDSVEIAAIPGSCAPPELPSQARPNFVHVIQLGIGLALLALGWVASSICPYPAFVFPRDRR